MLTPDLFVDPVLSLPFAHRGRSLTFVGSHFSFVGVVFAIVGNPFALIGEAVALVGAAIALVELGSPTLGIQRRTRALLLNGHGVYLPALVGEVIGTIRPLHRTTLLA